MEGIETGKDRVKKICDILRKDTLEPAQKEAEGILLQARERAERLLEESRSEAERLLSEARAQIVQERELFQTSLVASSRQAVETLKHLIEEKLFAPQLAQSIAQSMQDPHTIAKLIDAVAKALEKEGIDAPMQVYIASAVSARAVTNLLSGYILEKLKGKGVLLSPIEGGILVKLEKEQITIDISDAAVRELVARFTRKDFRELFFA